MQKVSLFGRHNDVVLIVVPVIIIPVLNICFPRAHWLDMIV